LPHLAATHQDLFMQADTGHGRPHAVDRVGPHVKQAVQYPHEGTVVRTAGDQG
jgi:hypothetical protein